jgi:hypothetical protein
MSATKATAVFLVWLIVAFLCVSLVTIYGFDYYEGALGSREDNVLLSAVITTAIALVITAGFAAFVYFRRSSPRVFQTLHLAIAAIVACGLVHLLVFAGPYLERFGSWQLNLGLLGLYSVVVGALTAAGMMRLAKGGQYAA